MTAVSPNSGPPAGGTSVTITGMNFTGATAVKFGSTAATSFSVNSATSITATSPRRTGTVDVTVTTPNGTSATSAADQFTYGQVSTATSLSSSQNPSSFGQSVTFTAKVTGSSPTGTVTLFDGGAQIGTATLANGAATFTTSSLAVGSHSLTAKYGGDANNAVSTSSALTQTVNVPADSIKLREMQVAVTPMVAQISGQAIAGAIDNAIDVGFSGNPPAFTPNGGGFTYYFDADPQAQRSASDQDSVNRFLASPNGSGKRVDDDFSALGYTGNGSMVTKAPPPAAAPSRDWLAWIDFRGTDFDRSTFGSDLKGEQINTVAGLTRKLSPDLLVGVLAGYEHFDYSSQAFNGVLKGDGWTTGTYLGWRLTQQIRFDAAAAWSDIFVNDAAGTASGNFTGHRWLTTGGVTGTYGWQSFVLEPSARIYALWEHENSYTDSLGTLQADRNFETGRASGGMKVSYPFSWSSAVNLAPYVGLYGDYYFSRDDALAAGLTTVPLLQGWSTRATGGVAATFGSGAQLAAGGEYGGIGGNTHIWTWRVRGSVPF